MTKRLILLLVLMINVQINCKPANSEVMSITPKIATVGTTLSLLTINFQDVPTLEIGDIIIVAKDEETISDTIKSAALTDLIITAKSTTIADISFTVDGDYYIFVKRDPDIIKQTALDAKITVAPKPNPKPDPEPNTPAADIITDIKPTSAKSLEDTELTFTYADKYQYPGDKIYLSTGDSVDTTKDIEITLTAAPSGNEIKKTVKFPAEGTYKVLILNGNTTPQTKEGNVLTVTVSKKGSFISLTIAFIALLLLF